MRWTLLGLMAAVGVAASGSAAHAQVPFTNVNDPFFAYYSFYLPRQQAQALSPGPEATINEITANRQRYAATNRTDMFDPRSMGGEGSLDAGDDFRPNAGALRRSISSGSVRSQLGGNLNGLGPRGHFNAANAYHPTLRTGRGRNANTFVHHARSSYGGGGIGLPGIR